MGGERDRQKQSVRVTKKVTEEGEGDIKTDGQIDTLIERQKIMIRIMIKRLRERQRPRQKIQMVR